MLGHRSALWQSRQHSSRGQCLRHAPTKHRRTLWKSRASGDDLPPVTRLSAEDACKLLDVSTSATFEEIVQAKNRKLSAADGDMDKVVAIENAYDTLFMRSMKKRISGELEVSTSVRYADVPAAPKRGSAVKATKQATAGSSSSGGAPSLKSPAPRLPPGGLPVGLALPASRRVALVQGGVFATCGLWALLQALLESPEAQLGDTAGLQVAVALGYSVYSMREDKKMGLGKATALTLGCLIAGALVGTGVEGWLRVDIVPIGSFSSPGVFVSEAVLLLMGLGCVFLV